MNALVKSVLVSVIRFVVLSAYEALINDLRRRERERSTPNSGETN